MHVYQGANEAGHQWYPFHRATNILNMEKVSIFYCNIKMVKDNLWNPKDLVDWLLNSDVHFIITHIHQGLEQLSWDMVELYNEVQRLRYHNGYPIRIHLRCPIWTQDKYDYLSAIANDGLCNPTYKVDLNIESLMDFEKIKDDIVCLLKCRLEGEGYVIKTPFSTNRANFNSELIRECNVNNYHNIYDKVNMLT